MSKYGRTHFTDEFGVYIHHGYNTLLSLTCADSLPVEFRSRVEYYKFVTGRHNSEREINVDYRA